MNVNMNICEYEDEDTFLFLNFLIIALCNSLANC